MPHKGRDPEVMLQDLRLRAFRRHGRNRSRPLVAVRKSCTTSIAARRGISAMFACDHQSGAGSYRERLALEQARRRVRRCGLRRKWRGAGWHDRTRGDVIAFVISMLLCSSGNGSGSVKASGRDTSQVEMRCQRRCWRVASARAMPTCPLPSQPRIIALNGRGTGRRRVAQVRRSTQG